MKSVVKTSILILIVAIYLIATWGFTVRQCNYTAEKEIITVISNLSDCCCTDSDCCCTDKVKNDFSFPAFSETECCSIIFNSLDIKTKIPVLQSFTANFISLDLFVQNAVLLAQSPFPQGISFLKTAFFSLSDNFFGKTMRVYHFCKLTL